MFLLVLNKFPCPSASVNVFLFVCKPIKHIYVIPLLKALAALGVVGAGRRASSDTREQSSLPHRRELFEALTRCLGRGGGGLFWGREFLGPLTGVIPT